MVQFTNKVVAAQYEADADHILRTKCYYGYISNISAMVAEQLIRMKHPGFREKKLPEQPVSFTPLEEDDEPTIID